MSRVADILASKGRQVWTVAPQTTVYETLERMAELNVGAMVVLEGAAVVGIFSERDYARKIILVGKASRDTPVRVIMTREVKTVGPQTSVDECMALMVDKHVRHLPVLDGGALVGVVSIGDVVKEVISHQRFLIEEQQRYISGV